METIKIVEGAIRDICDVRGHVAKEIGENGFVALIDEFHEQIESWEYYQSDGDLNFYDKDDELVLSFNVVREDGVWKIVSPRER